MAEGTNTAHENNEAMASISICLIAQLGPRTKARSYKFASKMFAFYINKRQAVNIISFTLFSPKCRSSYLLHQMECAPMEPPLKPFPDG